MITVTLVSNDEDGLPVRISVENGTNLGAFLDENFEHELEDFTVRVRSNGTSAEAHRDYLLKEGDRVSLTPAKIEGAAKGPGTNADQINSLRERMSEEDVKAAQSFSNNSNPDVVTLAYRLMRSKVKGQRKLPKALTNLLAGMSDEDANAIRTKLQQVRQ